MEESLGALLKALRKNKGLTLTQLSELTDISQSYLSQLETDKRTPSVIYLQKITSVLDAPYAAIIKLSGNPDFIARYNAKQILEGFPQNTRSDVITIKSDYLEALESARDLKVLLEQRSLFIRAEKIKPSFNGHVLSEEECERVLAMLYLLFPHYKESNKQ